MASETVRKSILRNILAIPFLSRKSHVVDQEDLEDNFAGSFPSRLR